MLENFSFDPAVFIKMGWGDFEPYFTQLQEQQLDPGIIQNWISDWSDLRRVYSEISQRLYVAITVDTTDEAAEKAYNAFLDELYPKFQAAEQKLKDKFLASGLGLPGFEIPAKNMRTEAAIYREENLPLLSEEQKLSNQYDKIIGAQTVEWEGKELTLVQLHPVYQELDRQKRERAWKLAAQRQLDDRQSLNDLWKELLDLRNRMAKNAGLPSFRDYRWQQFLRFDYTPEDCATFRAAIEQVVVPAARRIYEKRRQRLGVDCLRPWDLYVDTQGRGPLRPYTETDHLVNKVETIFSQVDPQLGSYFHEMYQGGLLDLENRKGKAPGGYCTNYDAVRKPFIFMNAVGLHDDVATLLHEGGHAFHVFESAGLPYHHQLQVGIEFAEVASTAMELLSAPYLEETRGGFYSPRDAARARIEHLEQNLLFLPYMAVVDGFQHWVYQNLADSSDPDKCDAYWQGLWQSYMVGVDWSGLDDELVTGWQRKPHIFEVPFYYVEYGLAMLGALQIWANALRDQAASVNAYRQALALGGTVPLPQLFATAGAKFAFDAGTLGEAVSLIERTLTRLEEI